MSFGSTGGPSIDNGWLPAGLSLGSFIALVITGIVVVIALVVLFWNEKRLNNAAAKVGIMPATEPHAFADQSSSSMAAPTTSTPPVPSSSAHGHTEHANVTRAVAMVSSNMASSPSSTHAATLGTAAMPRTGAIPSSGTGVDLSFAFIGAIDNESAV